MLSKNKDDRIYIPIIFLSSDLRKFIWFLSSGGGGDTHSVGSDTFLLLCKMLQSTTIVRHNKLDPHN